MRLCVPAGYGVEAGQRYELSTRSEGEQPLSPLRATVTFWVIVGQTQNMTDQDPDRINALVAVDQVKPSDVEPFPEPREDRPSTGPTCSPGIGSADSHARSPEERRIP